MFVSGVHHAPLDADRIIVVISLFIVDANADSEQVGDATYILTLLTVLLDQDKDDITMQMPGKYQARSVAA